MHYILSTTRHSHPTLPRAKKDGSLDLALIAIAELVTFLSCVYCNKSHSFVLTFGYPYQASSKEVNPKKMEVVHTGEVRVSGPRQMTQGKGTC